jgi:hypothetical protein
MSKIDVARRFSEVLENKDNYLSVSLPLISDGQEIIFLYFAESSDNGFSLKELDCIAIRDIETSLISIKSATDLFSKEEIDKFSASKRTGCITGTQALECVKKYYDLHEKLMQFTFREKPTTEEASLIKEYYEVFSEIVPESSLRSVYYRLGKSLFDYIQKHIC